MPLFMTKLTSMFTLGGSYQLGIDLGASAVKVVALKNNRTAPKVIGVGYEETPMGCIIDGMLSDTRSVAEVVKATLDRAGIKYKDQPATVGLRGLNVVYKRVLLPFQNPEEMGQQVLLEAQQQIDSELDGWLIDYQVIAAPDAQGQVPVMLVAAKRDAVEEYASLLQMVGVLPVVFDCDVFAIENAYQHSMRNARDTALCVDIGRDTTKINLLQEGTPIVVRSFPVGGAHLTEQISRTMQIDHYQAETMKISASSGDVAYPEITQSISDHVDEICEEIKRTLEFFANSGIETRIEPIERIILSGGGASTRGLPEKLGKFLGADVSYASPFANIEVSDKFTPIIANFSHVFNVSVGLALRYQGDKPT